MRHRTLLNRSGTFPFFLVKIEVREFLQNQISPSLYVYLSI